MSSTITKRNRLITAFLALAGTGLALGAFGANAQAKDVVVPVDEAILLRLERPAADIIVGNPSIADVSVQNSRLLVVTGKSFGMTNMIVLDSKGRKLLDEKVRVRSDETRQVRIYKGKDRASYDCAPRCEAALVPGDEAKHFEALAKEVRGKFGVAQQAMDGDSQNVQ
jgi:hypothetical protein